MKKGLFFFLCFFAVQGIVLGLFFEGVEKTAHSYALDSLGMLQNLEKYTFYLITYFSSPKQQIY